MSDITEAEHLVHDWQARLVKKAEAARELADRMAGTQASAEGAHGSVRVTVDSAGVPVAIDLGPAVEGWRAHRISDEIMATLRQAQQELTRTVEQLVADTPAAGQETGNALLAGLQQRFPADDDDRGMR